jgi:hypothetical protein
MDCRPSRVTESGDRFTDLSIGPKKAIPKVLRISREKSPRSREAHGVKRAFLISGARRLLRPDMATSTDARNG